MGILDILDLNHKRNRKNHFRNLVRVANADGAMHPGEMELLLGLAEKFHIRKKEADRILKSPEKVNPKRLRSQRKRIAHLYDLISVMLVDGAIDERELTLCKHLAVRLGIAEDAVDPLVRDLIDLKLNLVPARTAIKRVSKTYP